MVLNKEGLVRYEAVIRLNNMGRNAGCYDKDIPSGKHHVFSFISGTWTKRKVFLLPKEVVRMNLREILWWILTPLLFVGLPIG